MFDLLVLLLLTTAFAGAVGYVWACDNLTRSGRPRRTSYVNWQGWLQIAVFAALITAAVKPLGGISRGVSAATECAAQLRRSREWPVSCGRHRSGRGTELGSYALAMLVSTLWASSRCNHATCAESPAAQSAPIRCRYADLALNTAVSFATNTSWQSYGGETTLSYLRRWRVSPFSPSCLPDRRRRGHRAGAWFHPPVFTDDRQLLDRSYADHALCAAADLRRGHAFPRLAGCAADTRQLCQRDDLGRRQQVLARGRSHRRRRSSC